MAITSRITRNFQVTIPAEIRKRLSLKEGDVLAFGVKEGKLVVVPVKIGSKEWQEKEKEADEDIKAGRVLGPFEDLEEAFQALEKSLEK